MQPGRHAVPIPKFLHAGHAAACLASSASRKLPDDCSLEDIQYHLYVLEKIRRGLDDSRNGRTVPHEDVARRLSHWRDPA